MKQLSQSEIPSFKLILSSVKFSILFMASFIILNSTRVIVLFLIALDMGTSKSYFPVNFLRKSGSFFEQ